MLRRSAFALLLSSVFATSAQAGVVDLGSMIGNANIFTLGDFKSQWNDVQGAVVAGGSVNVQGYSINHNNVDAFGKDGYAVVARKDIKLDSGQLENGMIYAGGDIKLTSANSPAVSTTRPIDFDAAAAYYLSLSSDLAAFKPTGTVTADNNFAVVTGSGAAVDVFNVSGELLKNASDWKLLGVTTGQTLIFNVSGTHGTFRPWGIDFGPMAPYNVLFNFYEATTLDPTKVIGSVLAPKATVTSQWGEANGTFVVGSWDSTTQINSNHYFIPTELTGFRDPLPETPNPPLLPPVLPPVIPPVIPPVTGEVPEPGTFGLMAAALGLLAFSRKRARA